MSTDWTSIILNSQSPDTAWTEIFSSLLSMAKQSTSPVALHDATVMPDRLLTEAAWELWEAFPEADRGVSGCHAPFAVSNYMIETRPTSTLLGRGRCVAMVVSTDGGVRRKAGRARAEGQ